MTHLNKNSSTKRVGIIQSSYIPWRGYFDFINNVDLFIFHDDLQYTKGDWRNRNKIKTANGLQWITVPVKYHKTTQLICETKIDYSAGASPRSVFSADFDSDGDMDLAVTNWGSHNVSVLLYRFVCPVKCGGWKIWILRIPTGNKQTQYFAEGKD